MTAEIMLKKSLLRIVSAFITSLFILLHFGLVAAGEWELKDDEALHHAKTEPEVIQGAKKGIAQELIIVLEHKDLDEKHDKARREKNLPFNDDEINNQSDRDFFELKKRYLTKDLLGNAVLLHDY